MKKVKNYLKPVCSVETLQTEHLLGVVSGQHQPIGQGGSAGDAKPASTGTGIVDFMAFLRGKLRIYSNSYTNSFIYTVFFILL